MGIHFMYICIYTHIIYTYIIIDMYIFHALIQLEFIDHDVHVNSIYVNLYHEYVILQFESSTLVCD